MKEGTLVKVFNVFSYLTLRSILATMSALAIALLVGPFMIARLSRYQIGQVVRTDGPQSHLPKAGTPTMGGLLIIFAVVITTPDASGVDRPNGGSCGDGIIERNEGCDDGNTVSGDGCSSSSP